PPKEHIKSRDFIEQCWRKRGGKRPFFRHIQQCSERGCSLHPTCIACSLSKLYSPRNFWTLHKKREKASVRQCLIAHRCSGFCFVNAHIRCVLFLCRFLRLLPNSGNKLFVN